MTQEEKQLLLRDLCARLPYGVILQYIDKTFFPQGEIKVNRKLAIDDALQHRLKLLDFKPYLRPLSSMTEEEWKEYYDLCHVEEDVYNHVYYYNTIESIDWLNAHHFDYRGLIEIDLAQEAPKGMYKTNKNERNRT